MKTPEWIRHIDIQPRTTTFGSSPSTLRTGPLVRAVNGVAILAIVFGGLGTGMAGSHAHHHAGHANGHGPAHAIQHAASDHSIGITGRPWMP